MSTPLALGSDMSRTSWLTSVYSMGRIGQEYADVLMGHDSSGDQRLARLGREPRVSRVAAAWKDDRDVAGQRPAGPWHERSIGHACQMPPAAHGVD
jgi:hypothetical protein